jgi:hypothetical protein
MSLFADMSLGEIGLGKLWSDETLAGAFLSGARMKR